MRLCVPRTCRGYEGYYLAEHNRQIVFVTDKYCQCSLLCCSRPRASLKIIDRELENRIEDKEKKYDATLRRDYEK